MARTREGVNPRAGIPLRLQVAAIVREQIRSGELAPGMPTPSGPALADELGISRYTADRALDLLASEGLVERVTGIGTIVVGDAPAHEVIEVPPGTRISARLPAADEAPAGLPPGTPVLIAEFPDGSHRVYPADRTVIRLDRGQPLAALPGGVAPCR